MLCKKHLIMIFQTRNRECSLQEAAFRIQVQMQKTNYDNYAIEINHLLNANE